MLACMVMKTCEQVNPPLPASVRGKMQMNLAIDFIIRFVPFIGDFADAIYKCNTRNAALLENELRKRGESRLSVRPLERKNGRVPLVLIESMEEKAAYIHGGQGAWQRC
jgi:hypothetical protein